ncbi:hypothetical protein SAMN02745181_0785 [Rubritalea squalenifaciens DSM 18772]|uniref:Uncharacterized protein n=2 Tax=Rubritalea squalenifaciens TaxID=407226 RepID=A0A1M6DMI7_9BACT|nr:hypothetical protein SAMN02745181_0785 [Rubritalea squalenifaciens DSM 18772]
MTTEEALKKYKGLQDRYPCRQLFPFACRQDCDDVACWEREADEAVKIIHDFASPGWEDSGEYPDLWAWFRDAIDETIQWE